MLPPKFMVILHAHFSNLQLADHKLIGCFPKHGLDGFLPFCLFSIYPQTLSKLLFDIVHKSCKGASKDDVFYLLASRID